MPKGVEHVHCAAVMFSSERVFRSLMPKGVEHDDQYRRGAAQGVAVFRSLMPKGVEHECSETPAKGNYECSDL